jgi:hypothetical protein
LLLSLILVAVVATPATAGPEKVAFPSGYKSHVLYATVDRPDNKTVRDLSTPRQRPRAPQGPDSRFRMVLS